MKKYIISIAFLAGLLITLSVLLYPFVARYVNSRSQTRTVAQYIDDVAAIDDSSRRAILEAAREYNRKLIGNANRFRPSQAEKAEYLRQLDAGRGVMGILAIKKIDVSLPIYHGTEEGVLQVGLGHMQGTSLPVGGTGTHAFITGHRGLPSSKLLSSLDKMAEGDIFTLYILGETLTYQVDNIQIVEPHMVAALDTIDPDMDCCTLVTCTPYGVNTHRLLVRGQRIETPLSDGWDALSAEAKYLDKHLIILLFLVPILPVVMTAVILIYRNIRKRRNIMKRFLLAALSVLCVLPLLSGTARALDPPPSNLTVIIKYGETALEGIDVAVCHVAGAKEENGSIVYTAVEAFAGAGADFTNLTAERNVALAAALDAYAAAKNVARSSKITDPRGRATFNDLPAGLYLVAHKDPVNSEYVIAPYLVIVPSMDERLRQWDTNVIAYPKTEPVKGKVTSVSVYKVWDGVANPPAGGIMVQLYRDHVPYGNCVALNTGNNWSHTWEGLDPAGPWTVDEFDVPEGYVKTISGSASTGFVITNTRSPNAPGKTLISGSKTWVHGNNPAGKWPKSIVLRLSANGVFILQKEVGEAEHWSWSVRMDKYDKDGKEIVYTIDEAPVPGYSMTVDGYNLRNVYKQGPGGTPSPKTDDLNNLKLWLVLLGISFAGLLIVSILFRKYRRREKNLI